MPDFVDFRSASGRVLHKLVPDKDAPEVSMDEMLERRERLTDMLREYRKNMKRDETKRDLADKYGNLMEVLDSVVKGDKSVVRPFTKEERILGQVLYELIEENGDAETRSAVLGTEEVVDKFNLQLALTNKFAEVDNAREVKDAAYQAFLDASADYDRLVREAEDILPKNNADETFDAEDIKDKIKFMDPEFEGKTDEEAFDRLFELLDESKDTNVEDS